MSTENDQDQNDAGPYTEVLSKDEQALFDSMRDGAAAPLLRTDGEEPGGDAGEPDVGAGVADTGLPQPGAEGGADDGDDDDDDGAAPAAGAEGGAAPGPAEHKPRRVNAKKHERVVKELNDKLEATRQQLAEKDTVQARLDERLKLLQEALTPPAPGTPGAPVDPDDVEPELDEHGDPKDIFQAHRYQTRQIAKLVQTVQQLQSGRESEVSERQVGQAYVTDAQRFSSSEPNFGPAYNHLMRIRTGQLSYSVYRKAPADLNPREQADVLARMAKEEQGVVRRAFQENRSAAADIYALAVASGFTPMTPEQVAAAQAAANGGSAPAPGGKTNGSAAPSVVEQVEKLRDGRAAHKSLSDGGGTPASVKTLETIGKLSDAEFERLYESGPDAIRALLAGRAA